MFTRRREDAASAASSKRRSSSRRTGCAIIRSLRSVAEGSQESIHLNEAAGFVHVGTLKEVGRKFGRLLDVHIIQKILE